MKAFFTPILLAALCSLSLAAHAAPQAPEETLAAFYRWALAHPAGGLPSAGQRGQLSKVLSPQLVQLLQEASIMEARCMKTAPKGDKPLIIEGNLFVGNYEGASEVAYGSMYQEGDVASIEAKLVYVDPRFPRAHKHRAVAWKDAVELRLREGRWLVSDVRFEQGGSLATTLKAYLMEGERTCVKP